MPTLFSRGATTPISPDEAPVIMYGARGVGTLWQTEPGQSPKALVGPLASARHGRSVLYLRSELGDALVTGVSSSR